MLLFPRIFCIAGQMADAVMWHTVLFSVLLSSRSVDAQVSYSIPEEMSKGSIVGNIAQDLGLDLKRLKSGKARIYTAGSTEYIELNRERGSLLIKEKIDRESLCAKKTPCALHLQMILESPMERYTITVEITDINDNAPLFTTEQIKIEISEATVPGARFMLARAMDADVGTNGLQSYSLKPTDHFVLQNQADDDKSLEMILQKTLDREKQETFTLLLTAMDGGEPVLSGTVQIHVTVLDANDNAPVFTQKVYRATLMENAPKGTKLITVIASDADEGSNGRITYYISKTVDLSSDLFIVDQYSGNVVLNAQVDFEENSNYQLEIQAKDQGGLSDSCKVIIDVLDINDNRPSINILSMSQTISEESSADTVVAMINVNDPDSGENGNVQCIINDNIPFIIKSSSNNFFSLHTNQELDREREAEYNITVTCSDEGVPSLSSSTSLRLHISDVNDNAPVFEKNHYEAYVVENNTPGLSIFTVKASDADYNQNARVSYILEESTVNGVPVSSYVSVSADSGVINAVRSFDYEQLKDFHFRVRAQDGGSPPLSSNVTVKITIQDQNDNAPQVLYPVQTGGSVVAEIVPRSADVGYLVTKVVAVDVDSGQNAWLSYKLQKATDRALFEVGAQNGEIRTVRQVTDKDAVKQKLTVVVEDNGQPSRSAVVNINVAVADTFPEVLSEFTDFTHSKQYNDDLTFYLVLALAAVSFLFITTVVVIISVKIYRWRQSRIFYQSNLPVIPYYPPGYTDTGVTGTLPHMYNYDASMTTDSRKSNCKYSTLGEQSVLVMDPSFTENLNDNKPTITVLSMVTSLSEESSSSTVVAMINVNDPDSGENGKVQCALSENIPFAITSSSNTFFSLLTDQELDREKEAEYNITVTCSDEGVPSLSSSTSLRLHISDVNDNAPVFEKNHYDAYVVENNTPGLSIFTVKASDADSNQNARVSYILEESTVNGVSVSSYVSVSADSGVINAVRSFDYEQLKDFHFCVRAQDGGSPPLSSNVTVKITIQDQNDNAPQVLYPVQTGGSVVAEIVPRSADVGYLVTKVVAVDVDSGQNAWLSYKLQKATDRALFEVGAQNGEIRTVRQVTDKDAVKQKLTVVVEDNGQPSRSAVVNINVAVADTFPEVLSEFTDFTHSKQYNDDLTFYLVLALAAVSFLFITTVVVIISVKIYRWRQSRIFYQSNLPVIPYYPPGYTDTGVTGTLPHMYNYDACMTTDSRKSACKYSTLGGQSVLVMDPSFTETMQRAMKESNRLDEADSPELQKPPNNDWRLPPNQRPGPSGQHRFHTLQQRWTPYEKSRAGARPEEAGAGAIVGTGPWPNPPTEAEQLQALMAAANEVSEATATLGPRYNAQYVPDYRQNVYIPGSTATLTANPQQQMPQQALPPPQAPPQAVPTPDIPKAAPTPASKKKVTKKDKK
ncbi:protocadherin gamma-A8-like isoform 34-T34 [Clarias gariepinus]